MSKKIDEKRLNYLYTKFKNGDTLYDISKKLNITLNEVYGFIELLNMSGKQVEIKPDGREFRVYKKRRITHKITKPELESLTKTRLCVIGDTHLGTKEQQLTLLNEVYKEAYRREIDTVIHCGDLVDGDYHKIRPQHRYQVFLDGFDEQCEYVIEYYPRIKGIKTLFIQGSHDETHLKNGGATPGKWISKLRKDMIYLGQDNAKINMEKVTYEIDHPGGGSTFGLSYKPQKYIEQMTPNNKPNVLFQGHYHKCYYMFYRNVHAFLVPCLVDKTQFMMKNKIANIVGAYFLDIYSNNKGNVEYIGIERHLFNENQIKKNDYMKCKRLEIL